MQSKIKTRKELNREYMERVKPAGIYQVKNTANGKMLLGSSLNLEGPLNRHKFMLKIGSHTNKSLQKDWDELGPDNFVFEILEEVKVVESPNFNLSDELTLLEMLWLEKLQPVENGYNLNARIREA
ncbi:MAG: GIY-YIG nuclease family protein [Anaerolineales bacterium]|nr:GIY-YIG nuclease family protein [Anaerolineales bacterium]